MFRASMPWVRPSTSTEEEREYLIYIGLCRAKKWVEKKEGRVWGMDDSLLFDVEKITRFQREESTTNNKKKKRRISQYLGN